MPANSSPGAQLTIFYNGSVSVYDAITPEKAQAIMFIAAAAAAAASAAANNNITKVPMMAGPNAATIARNSPPPPAASVAAAAALTRSLSQQSFSGAAATTAAAAASPQPQLLPNPNTNSLCKLQAELPIARRHSLQQFLEKRRSRVVSKAPYVSAKKSDGGMEVGIEGKSQLT